MIFSFDKRFLKRQWPKENFDNIEHVTCFQTKKKEEQEQKKKGRGGGGQVSIYHVATNGLIYAHVVALGFCPQVLGKIRDTAKSIQMNHQE